MAQTPKSKLIITKYKQTPIPPRSHFPDAPNPYAFNLQPSGSDLNYPTNTLTASKKKNQKKINSPNIIKTLRKKIVETTNYPKPPILSHTYPHPSSYPISPTVRTNPTPGRAPTTHLRRPIQSQRALPCLYGRLRFARTLLIYTTANSSSIFLFHPDFSVSPSRHVVSSFCLTYCRPCSLRL